MTESAHLQISGLRAHAIIQNCHTLLWRKYRGRPLWALVSDIFGHGSTISADICRFAGLDPDQEIARTTPQSVPALVLGDSKGGS